MKDYYQTALYNLRSLGARFAKEHPTVAPLLSSQSVDPDVERIMEGVAFLNGLINQRLDENFPEIVTTLLELTAPELLKPIPSQSLVKFTPLANVHGVQKILAGSILNSMPVENITCPYSLIEDCNILPIKSCNSRIENILPKKAIFHVSIDSLSPVTSWWSQSIRFYLNDYLARASQWHMILQRFTKKITVHCGNRQINLRPSSLHCIMPKASPFSTNKENSLSGSTMIRDFFTFPAKFLFLTLQDLLPLKPTSEAFKVDIAFELENFPVLPELVPSLFHVNIVPVMNIFAHDATPFSLNHTQQDYHLVPEGDTNGQMEICRINEVTGVQRGGKTRKYHSYSEFEYWQLASEHKLDKENIEDNEREQHDVYNVRRAISPINGRMEYHLSVIYNDIATIRTDETLVAKLYCYHHTLPLYLRVGDICNPTDSSPAMATFTNIINPTSPIPAPRDPEILWQLFSHLHANLLPLASVKALRHFLSLFVPWEENDTTLLLFNKRRIASIVKFQTIRDEMLIKGRPISGQKIHISIDSSGFTSAGEMFLFGTILEQALNHFVTINTYTKFEIQDTVTGEIITWPPRLGMKRLI